MVAALALVAVLVALLVAGLATLGARRWSTGTAALRARLESARRPLSPTVVDFGELAAVPPPVARYLRSVLREGQPLVAAVRLSHRGTFDSGSAQPAWRRFCSDQRVITSRPGFDWDARIVFAPGLEVRVHDAYVEGEGRLHASLLGLLTVADVSGTREVAHGELMRFFAESAWYPTVLLPSQGVTWEAIDDSTARGHLVDNDLRLQLDFHFDAAGRIETVTAEARGRTVGTETLPTPWQGRFWNYEERGGMRIPLDGEVAWLLPEGPRPYWRGRIETIEFEWASPP